MNPPTLRTFNYDRDTLAAAYTAELHPRRMKIIDYCSSHWNEHGCDCQPYPSLEHWRRDAENYLPPENVAD